MKHFGGFGFHFLSYFYKTAAKSRQNSTFAQTLLGLFHFKERYFGAARGQSAARAGTVVYASEESTPASLYI